MATYSLAFCPDSTNGNISITNPVLVDNFPAGATVFNAGGGVVDTINNTITWTPPTLDDPLRPSDGCETVTYTLEFPSASFPVGTAFTNSASGDGDNPEIGEQAFVMMVVPIMTLMKLLIHQLLIFRVQYQRMVRVQLLLLHQGTQQERVYLHGD